MRFIGSSRYYAVAFVGRGFAFGGTLCFQHCIGGSTGIFFIHHGVTQESNGHTIGANSPFCVTEHWNIAWG